MVNRHIFYAQPIHISCKVDFGPRRVILQGGEQIQGYNY